MKTLSFAVFLLCGTLSFGEDFNKKEFKEINQAVSDVGMIKQSAVEINEPVNLQAQQNKEIKETISNIAKALTVLAGLVVFYFLVIFPAS